MGILNFIISTKDLIDKNDLFYIVNYFKNMKKLQNYLMKPQELRKKLQNPRFRQDFVQWSRSNLSINKEIPSRNSRSKSPLQSIQKSIQLNHKKTFSTSGKENSKLSNGKNIGNSKTNHNRTALGQKHNGSERNKSQMAIKKNISNTFLGHAGDKERPVQLLTNKNRYNSMSSIQQKKTRSASNFTSSQREEQKIKQKLKLQLKYSYRTRQGVQITNPNKVNQDSLVIKTNLAQRGTYLFAVADGHGAFGHLVSQYIVKNISKIYEQQIKTTNIPESIPRIFQKIQKGLTDSDINVSCSGSTLVNVIIDGDQIICANVGDSRAILARQIDRKSWQMIYLSQDHKPSNEQQKKRILKLGGRVHAFKDENGNFVGPQRVWLPNQSIQYSITDLQGLAMSRSFGDNVSKQVGVTSEPQIIKMRLDKRDKFILLASDGVWQFITNQEVLQLIVPFYKEGRLEQACDALSKLAYQRWTSEDNSIVDDITFVLIFLGE